MVDGIKVIILFAVVAETYANELKVAHSAIAPNSKDVLDKLIQQLTERLVPVVLKAPPAVPALLVNTTLGKSNHLDFNLRATRRPPNLLRAQSANTQSDTSVKVQKPAGFVPPEPKPLTLTRSSELPSVLKSSAALIARLATGAFVLGWKIDTLFADESRSGKEYSLKLGPLRLRDSSSVLGKAPRPGKPLILYEYEGSPFCRKVREICNLLDLTVEYRPCPGAREGFSDELQSRTGRRTVPYLVDPNTGKEMFESSDQIEYLLKTYGPDPKEYDKKALWPITFQPFSLATSVIATSLRGFAGSRRQPNARPDNEKMQPLELWGYECSPFVKPVQEKLCSLCLPHLIVSCSRGSANRDAMINQTGRFQVPYLVDPNTGVNMFESPEIVEYLEKVYTTG